MILTFHGHSCFKLKGADGTVVTDPFHEYIGYPLPSMSADIVTVSHDHKDHASSDKIRGTARRKNPFIVDKSGEYEVCGISVFGVPSFHDDSKGAERGPNVIFTILIDGLRVCHLGDLGHELSQTQIEAIGSVDILLCPVGGTFTLDPKTAVKVIRAIEPSITIPMHYNTPDLDQKVFADLKTRDEFAKEFGAEIKPVVSLDISRAQLPEENELVILERT
ncbi:MAG: MBL fold metallo-hydrolase [Candidatus Pacebacteria bacterium CG10_big_fil_rev_8_21_14_0_10_42_12]|nr:MBL fold metallo-hydrolase [Candidatus Paceibacterota bacterium]PIR62790.1 MAG: MBL fold metallo-hydrolase [Candidatus Pacebacteria bacterium CG10_big_fil_rev_8_21_14_0_10_42_12]